MTIQMIPNKVEIRNQKTIPNTINSKPKSPPPFSTTPVPLRLLL